MAITMRLFIAVNLPKEVKDYLWQLKEEYHGLGKIKFTPKKDYHITLKFLGEVKEDRLEEIKQRLSNVHLNSFTASLYELGHFNYGVLWVSSDPKEKIIELARKVDEQLLEYPNDYPPNPHITLARIKSLKNKKEFEKKLGIEVKKMEFRVASFELMKSELSKDGSKYSIMETYSLE